MALVNNPALSMAASGNVGALNYSRYRGRAVARAAYSPVQPNTPGQVAQQAYFLSVQSAWSSLTLNQTAEWDELGASIPKADRLQNYYRQTGRQIFYSWNLIRLMMGYTVSLVPAAQQQVLVETLALRTISAGKIGAFLKPYNFDLPYWNTEYMIAGPFSSVNRKAQLNNYRVQGIVITRFELVIDGLTSGKYYWIRARALMRCGRTLNWWSNQILTT